ncbi:hypothetical protein PL8927_600165 [Planktothrix serta PCC 8927]|uniref:Uncharacterized protein n=1 Tax=Planktothrix serta PCC 8927 TaxID=671068 RepID=A0A7Z9BMI4_9CYAN|nr:hypothetical protein PL8927_600165 [Planktothrix serta PCC 8927]
MLDLDHILCLFMPTYLLLYENLIPTKVADLSCSFPRPDSGF